MSTRTLIIIALTVGSYVGSLLASALGASGFSVINILVSTLSGVACAYIVYHLQS